MEFQVVVLAGGNGNRLQGLCDKAHPKALLPVGNKPMIWYPIQTLININFPDIIVLTSPDCFQAVSKEVKSYFPQEAVRVLHYSEDRGDRDVGTCESLHDIAQHLTSDFFVISCDSVGSINFHDLVNDFRIHEPIFSCVLSPKIPVETRPPSPGKLPGEFWKRRDDTVICTSDDAKQSQKLIALHNSNQVDSGMFLNIPKAQLLWNPRLNLQKGLVDTHCYLFSQSVIGTLDRSEDFVSLQANFLPQVLSVQDTVESSKIWHRHIHSANFQTKINSMLSSQEMPTEDVDDEVYESGYLYFKKQAYSALTIPRSNLGDDYFNCLSFVQRQNPIQRLSNYADFLNFSLNLCSCKDPTRIPSCYLPTDKLQRKDVKDVIIHPSVEVPDGVKIIRSVIGEGVKIAPNVKITNSVVLGGAIISEKCVVESSIVGYNAKLEINTKLKNCVIGNGAETETGDVLEEEELLQLSF